MITVKIFKFHPSSAAVDAIINYYGWHRKDKINGDVVILVAPENVSKLQLALSAHNVFSEVLS